MSQGLPSTDLRDRTVIITGAGHGLGAVVALALGRAGARVAVNDINPDRAEQVAGEIQAAGGEALAMPADVASKYQCVSLVEAARAAWGRLDALVNNATVRPRDPMLTLDEWEWARCLNVNLKGMFFMSQLTARVMVDENGSRGGDIVNLVHDAGLAGASPGTAVFAASQAGALGLTRACAAELGPLGLRVNAVLRGTREPTGMIPDLSPAGQRQGTGKVSAEHRVAVASLVCRLCAQDAGSPSGKLFAADGAPYVL